jgi:hypothetical protein
MLFRAPSQAMMLARMAMEFAKNRLGTAGADNSYRTALR